MGLMQLVLEVGFMLLLAVGISLFLCAILYQLWVGYKQK